MRRVILSSLILGLLFLSASCSIAPASKQRRESIETRAEMFQRAEAKIPVPRTENFPLREVLAEYTRRQDLPNHPWYTYIISDTGAITHYFVSTTVPVSSLAFLSSTEDLNSENNLILTAPSLDGIFYGGAGAVATSGGWIFIDAGTGAMGIVFGMNIMTFDAPLILETEPLLIQARK